MNALLRKMKAKSILLFQNILRLLAILIVGAMVLYCLGGDESTDDVW